MNISISSLIQMVIGIYITLIGFGKVSVSKDPEKNKVWMDKWGTLFKVGGPALIAIGGFLLFAGAIVPRTSTVLATNTPIPPTDTPILATKTPMNTDINKILKIYLGTDDSGGYAPYGQEDRLEEAYPNDHAEKYEQIERYLDFWYTPDTTSSLSEIGAQFAIALKEKYPELDEVSIKALMFLSTDFI